MIKGTVVLDLDGTLADTIRDLIPVLNRSTEPEGLPPIGMEDIGHVVGHGARAMIARAYSLHNTALEEATLERIFDRFLADYEQNLAVDTILFEGAEQALATLADRGYALAVCTNKMERFATRLLSKLEVETWFAAIAGGDTFHYRKPDPRHLTDTIAMAGGTPDRAVMVGDSITDIATAKGASIPVIAVDFGYSDRPVVEYEPDRVISAFRHLPEIVDELLAKTGQD